MGLSKEILNPWGNKADFSPVNYISPERKVNILPIKEARVKTSIPEPSQLLFSESKKGKETGTQLQTETLRKDGFEPFANPEPSGDMLFVNGYYGNFYKNMYLNRRAVERVLKIAHLDGKVVLSSLAPSRDRSSEIQDNELAGKRFLFFGEKTQEDNPLYRVVSVPEGWRIEINDQRITEELAEKQKLTGEKLQTEFIKQFNGQLKRGILECLLKEKLTGKKDKYFGSKLFHTLIPPTGIGLLSTLLTPLHFTDIILAIGWTDLSYIVSNSNIFNSESSRKIDRKIDHKLEYLAPLLEIDKVARAAVFLAGKGRTLVKEIKQPKTK